MKRVLLTLNRWISPAGLIVLAFAAVLLLVVGASLNNAAAAPAESMVGTRFDNATHTIVLTDSPCPEPVRDMIVPEALQHYRFAAVLVLGRPVAACWRDFPEEGYVFIIDQNGAFGPMPRTAFKRPLTI